MTRPLDAATVTAINKQTLPFAAIVYLDVENDPLFAWSGIGDLVFAAGQTGDPSLDGKTFTGLTKLIELGGVSEGAGGSDALEIGLPGVSIQDNQLKQLITDHRRWQFRRAIVWIIILDDVTYEIAGKPFRIKTGRMDKMPYTEGERGGTVKCRIEGQQAYGNQPLATRYSEQIDLNPNDISQKYVHALANMTATIGKVSGVPGSGSTSGLPSGFTGRNFLTILDRLF